ncbi:MAG: site-specific DNA-methyltransferase [Armatimonadetes bacterium]|nr:site-specific DNA-methyltransferase [Armatimonadota bacterium]
MERSIDVPGITDLEAAIPPEARPLLASDLQRAIPAIAKDPRLAAAVESQVQQLASRHRLIRGDARDLSGLADESVHLVVTSPPYWTLKEYRDDAAQLGHIEDYELFLDALDEVWRHVLRVLVPGGRLVVVVGDVCLPRRRVGRHLVMPLHASIQERCRLLGFDNLNPIIWHKIANAKLEVDGPGGFLGKPYEPNAVVKNDIEFILFQRKPGGYRQPSIAEKVLSLIPEAQHRQWFQQIWTLTGASTREHPAPYPVELAERLVRMFSFVGDTVLDPFSGTATTSLAALRCGRHSIGVEVIEEYYHSACDRLIAAAARLPAVEDLAS